MDDFGIRCKEPYSFSVIYCDIEVEGREVRRWTQPLFKAEGIAIGLILDVPPLQLTEEQIEDYKKKLWIESMRIPLFNPFKLK